jgi:hypothetical protein
METKNNILTQYRSRIIFPPAGALYRGGTKRATRVLDYILPAKRRKKERVSERVRETLYKQ